MLLTKRNSFLFVMLLLCGVVSGSAAELTSRNVRAVVVRGDTACLVTDLGINWTTALADSPVVWSGQKAGDANQGTAGYDAAIGPEAVLFCLSSGGHKNEIQIHSMHNSVVKSMTIPFPENVPSHDWLDFRCGSAVWLADCFWVGAGNGGLVRIDTVNLRDPGKPQLCTGFYFGEIVQSFGLVPSVNEDSATAVAHWIADIAAGPSQIAVARRDSLFLFTPYDSSWAGIAWPDNMSAILDIEASPDRDSLVYLSCVLTESDTPDTVLYRMSKLTADHIADWQIVNHGYVPAYAPALGRTLYLSDANSNLRYCLDTGAVLVTISDPARYQTRFGGNVEINDISVSFTSVDSSLVIATTDGIYFTTREPADRELNTLFHHVTRMGRLSGDLEEVYAYPSIINTNDPSCTIAYCLGKSGAVTIDIYDYNMDLVIRLIDKENRNAGTENSSGRSTDPARDIWDGSVGGRIVAPGVYYFVVRSEQGKKAFGKIIVAKR